VPPLLIAIEQNPTTPERFIVSANHSFVRRQEPRALPFFEQEAKKRTRGPGKKGSPNGDLKLPKHLASDDAAIAFDTSARKDQRAFVFLSACRDLDADNRAGGGCVRITGWKKLCYDSSGLRDEENRDEDGARF
jgi:hypothetical protein